MEKDDRGPYYETLFLEAILSAFRFLPAIFPAAVVGGVVGVPLLLMSGAEEWGPVLPGILWLAAFLALSPVIASVLTLTVLPGGYGLTRWELGARKPEVWEREALLGALQELTESAPSGTVEPSRWLVVNKIELNAFVIGTTIYVHSELFRTPHFLPVLAHELGHLNHGDGRLVLALRRLVPPPLSYLSFEGGGYLPWLLKLFGGGLGLSLMTPFWNRYWQKRELLADRFAFECGQADGLIEFLDVYEFFDVAVPFHSFTSDHPYIAERIGRLQDLLEEEPLEQIVESKSAVQRLRPEPALGALTPEQEQLMKARKLGFTDAESVLDLVFLDEDQVGSGADEQIAVEKEWIRANGLRIVDLLHFGTASSGPSAMWLYWLGGDEEQYRTEAFHYITREAHSYLMGDPEDGIAGKIPPGMAAKWHDLVVTHDPARQFIVVVLSLASDSVKDNLHQYLVGMRGGGPLPKWGEEPPGRG